MKSFYLKGSTQTQWSSSHLKTRAAHHRHARCIMTRHATYSFMYENTYSTEIWFGQYHSHEFMVHKMHLMHDTLYIIKLNESDFL